MRTAGLDLSFTGTGIVVVSGKQVLHRALVNTEVTHGSDEQRIGMVIAQIEDILGRYEPDRVGIEGPAFGKPHQSVRIGMMQGIVRYWLWQHKYTYRVVPPPVLERFALGKAGHRSHEKKALTVAKARAEGVQTFDDNVADAYFCARWAIREWPEAPRSIPA